MKKLNPMALGLAMGITFAVFFFMIVVISMYANWGGAVVSLLGSLYMGVEATWTGALLVLPWAFVDAFIGGFIMAWLYNKFA